MGSVLNEQNSLNIGIIDSRVGGKMFISFLINPLLTGVEILVKEVIII